MNTSRLKERYESPTVEKCQVMLEQMMAGSKYERMDVTEEWDYQEVPITDQDIIVDFN